MLREMPPNGGITTAKKDSPVGFRDDGFSCFRKWTIVRQIVRFTGKPRHFHAVDGPWLVFFFAPGMAGEAEEKPATVLFSSTDNKAWQNKHRDDFCCYFVVMNFISFPCRRLMPSAIQMNSSRLLFRLQLTTYGECKACSWRFFAC